MASLSEKIIGSHLVYGSLSVGGEVAVSIDQTLTQDATGTVTYLQFEALGIPRVKTKLSVSYVDHNTLQTGPENADDHRYLQSVAAKYGVVYSKPGNGICHQIHLERFGVPGQILLGSDSHTPTQGGLGMLAIGAGGLDVAVAMGGEPFYLTVPKVLGVCLSGRLSGWSSAKDVILHLLKRLSVKGGVGRIMEYFGDGVPSLSVPERATIANMGAELGATTSIFPSDGVTKKFLNAQGREKVWKQLRGDGESDYKEKIEVDLTEVEPLAARPHSPDNASPVSELEGLEADQIIIGSCTNSSLKDLLTVAYMLKGRSVHPDTSLAIAPGSRQVLEMLAESGAISVLLKAGARILEPACGPCIGMGLSPPSGGVSLRTFNRNFKGRSGTYDAKVFLVSPETAAASAIYGKITDPRKLGKAPKLRLPERFKVDDSLIIRPPKESLKVKVIRGPNIKPLPESIPLPKDLTGQVILKVGDNITTDDIMPAGAKILPLRSNIPAISEFVYSRIDSTFAERARKAGTVFIVGGINYGQGSSREHAALAPRYLGVKAILAKSFARIHKANLINFGILPLEFKNEEDYDAIKPGVEASFRGLRKLLEEGGDVVAMVEEKEIKLKHDLTKRQTNILLAGGMLNYVKERHGR